MAQADSRESVLKKFSPYKNFVRHFFFKKELYNDKTTSDHDCLYSPKLIHGNLVFELACLFKLLQDNAITFSCGLLLQVPRQTVTQSVQDRNNILLYVTYNLFNCIFIDITHFNLL